MQQKNKKDNSTLLDKRAASSIPMIVFCFILLAIVVALVLNLILKQNDQEQEPEKQKNADIISINLIGGSLVDETQYNIWFYINCNETDGNINLKPSLGYVLKMDITNESNIQPAETINPSDAGSYVYIWVVEKAEKDFVGYIDVEYENSITLKTASIYSIFSDETIGFLEKSQYDEYKQAVEEKNSEQTTE